MARTFLFSPSGAPCNPPPWGALSAIDLTSGALRWERPLGFVPALAGLPGADSLGSLNLGGAIVTGGGLVFVAGTRTGGAVTFTVPFTNATDRCAGTIRATAALANGGRLFVGQVHITGACSGAEPEDGTFALRRATAGNRE